MSEEVQTQPMEDPPSSESDLEKSKTLWRVPGIGNRKEIITVLAIQISMALFLIVMGAACSLYANTVQNESQFQSNAPSENESLHGDEAEAQKNIREFGLNDVYLTNGKSYFSVWQMTHLVAYFILAALFPDSWFLIWSLGFFWEVLEHFAGWSNASDVAINATGVGLGVAFRKLLIDRVAVPMNNKTLVSAAPENVIGAQWTLPMGVSVAGASIASLFIDTEGETKRKRMFHFCLKKWTANKP